MPIPTPRVSQWWDKGFPQTLEGKLQLLTAHSSHLQEKTDEGQAVRALYKECLQAQQDIVDKAKKQNPLSFVKLSWEQALKLNSWVWGITFLIDFDANRKGKTAGTIFNALFWMLPNDPSWVAFQTHVDEWDRTVRLIQRPRFRKILRIQQYLQENPHLQGDPRCQPYDEESGNAEKFAILQNDLPDCFRPAFPLPSFTDDKMIMWHGAPDAGFHKDVIMPEWKKWLPKINLTAESAYERTMTVTVSVRIPHLKQYTWNIIFKSYESDDTKWSGSAVNAVLLTEGVNQTALNEVKQRFKEEAFASWDYTPYEPRNTGKKTAIAHRVYQGKEELPLCSYIYSGMGIEFTPSYILPDSKRDDLLRMWGNKPEGQARISGKFYSSSPVALSNLDREFHCIQWTKKHLFNRFPEGRLYRGIDPGFDHPTACAWALLSPANDWYIYRSFAESGLSLGDRCKKIIELSGNLQHKVPWGRGEDDYYYEEIHPFPHSEVFVNNFLDYHTFKVDEATLQPYANNYKREGLLVTASITMGPRERAQLFDKKLEREKTRPHPISRIPPGSRVYFLINEYGVAEMIDKLENLFWDRYATGAHKGEAKDQLVDIEDDEFDASSYLICSPARWSPYRPKPKSAKEVEPRPMSRR